MDFSGGRTKDVLPILQKNNKFNPDPSKTVYYGDMTWEEMMFPFFSVIVDKNVNPRRIISVVRGRRAQGA